MKKVIIGGFLFIGGAILLGASVMGSGNMIVGTGGVLFGLVGLGILNIEFFKKDQ